MNKFKEFFGPSMALSLALVAIQVAEKILSSKKEAQERDAMEARLIEEATKKVLEKLNEDK